MWATPEDVRSRWVLDTPLTLTDLQIQRHLNDAEDMILTEFPSMQMDVLEGRVPQDRVVRVVCGMVLRFFKNREGIRSTSTTTGPFSEQQMLAGDRPGELYLSDEDRRTLQPRRRSRRAFTVMPGGW